MDKDELISLPKDSIVDDLDRSGAAAFLVKHHVPFIGPDMGAEMIKIVKRLDALHKMDALPPTVDAYRLAMHLALEVAAHHQAAFCDHMESLLS